MAAVRRWSLYGGYSNKISMKISSTGFRLVVVDRWLEVVINTGSTVLINADQFFFEFFFDTKQKQSYSKKVIISTNLLMSSINWLPKSF